MLDADVLNAFNMCSETAEPYIFLSCSRYNMAILPAEEQEKEATEGSMGDHFVDATMTMVLSSV